MDGAARKTVGEQPLESGEGGLEGPCLGKGPPTSSQPPRPLCLADEFKQDMVIACLQRSPNHKSLCKKNGKAIKWEDSSLPVRFTVGVHGEKYEVKQHNKMR